MKKILFGLLFFCFIFMILPTLAQAEDSNVYAVWMDDSLGNYEIFFKRSYSGITLAEPYQNLSDNSGVSSYPSIAVDGNNLYVVWYDTSAIPDNPEPENPDRNPDVFFMKSIDGGSSWSEIKNISKNVSNSETWGISIVADSSNLYVAWSDDGLLSNDIFFTKSTDWGDTWDEQPINISNNLSDSYSIRASMAVDSDNIYVVWEDVKGGIMRSFFNRSTDGGLSWTDPTYLGDGMCPVIAINGQYLYVIRGGGRFTWSKDYGETWELDEYLGWGLEPFIAVSGADIYIVQQTGGAGEMEIEFIKGTLINDTVEWEDSTNLLGNSGNSTFPVIATADGENIYVIWMDNTLDSNPNPEPHGKNEIFYMMSVDGGENWRGPWILSYSEYSDSSVRPKVTAGILTTLSVTKIGAGVGRVYSLYSSGIYCGSDCQGDYEYGTEVVLIAIAARGCRFTRWIGCDYPDGTRCTMIMDGDRNVIVRFN